ncbi:Growth factor receptor-bound protein 10 [Acipenser ruthenus]|uniref:Growth factor receptor-bound protein 10 n=1 Tax=Acipenser ruthenus TaxID=7906 RepID=A0A662YKM9_ACIRT|nr:Growth factor receptor-bound protein 10 [Acipenser ruthenus]
MSASLQELSNEDDDVDLEALVNDMNSSFESLYSTCSTQSESAPLLQNGQFIRSHIQTSGIAPMQPTSPQQKVRRSQPVHILAVRRLQEKEQQLRTSSLPAIPNPFPELCSPASSPVLSPGSLPQDQPSDKNIIKVCSENGTSKVVEIPADMTARDLCQLLVYKSHCVDDSSWSLVEYHPHLGLDRSLEDHEHVVQVQSTMASESKFVFRKNYAKYEFFKNPANFFPEQMVAWCQETNSTIPSSQLLQEPRHLQLLADLEDSNIFSVITSKKLYNAPTDFGFCIKPNKARHETKELRLLCAEDEQSRTCWITVFRVFKYGILLYQNYKIPQQGKSLLSHFITPVRSVSENSLVAMDFSGRIGRVIDNPVEAQSAAMEEGHVWRKRSQRMNILGSPSPLHPNALNTDAIAASAPSTPTSS